VKDFPAVALVNYYYAKLPAVKELYGDLKLRLY
jgi:hypothetical protein